MLILSLVLGVGFFLRSYHFSDWLHFELDQARDARVVESGLQGDFFDLPLLGPKAAGTSLRLPPSFYYLEYVSALVFGSDPAGQARGVALFSVFALGALFLFLKRFFSVSLTLGLTSLAAVSPFLVMYGRFSWNPNFLPFFLLFGFYALLRAVDREEAKSGFFLGLSGFFLGLATQFHFLAFVGIPIIAFLLLLIKRPKIAIRYWGVALSIVILLYVPLFLNEVATGGRNTTEFIKALSSKTNTGESSFVDRAIRNTTEQILGYGLVVSGFERAELPKVRLFPTVSVVCDDDCKIGFLWGVLFTLFYGSGIVLLGWFFSNTPPGSGRDFLILIGLWFGITWILFLNIATSFSPRFLLLVTPLPFIWLGFIGKIILEILGDRRRVQAGVWILLGIIGISSLGALNGRFRELAQAASVPVVLSGPDRILKERTRITLEQQELIVDFMAQRSRETGFPVYRSSEPEYQRSLSYHLTQRGIINDGISTDHIYQEGLYFLILRSQSDLEGGMKKYLEKYTVAGTFPFGTLTVLELKPKLDALTATRQDFSTSETSNDNPSAAPRYTWREFWERRAAQSDEPETDEESQ